MVSLLSESMDDARGEEGSVSNRADQLIGSYGEKPAWFLKKVPSGLLPVLELDGKIITESLVIMQIIEQTFPDIPMIPEEHFDRANTLLRLERQLFSDWCGLVFRPSGPGPFGGGARKQFEETFDKVNAALGELPGPWFLGGDTPSIVDLQYVSHVERMNASLPVLERTPTPFHRTLGKRRKMVCSFRREAFLRGYKIRLLHSRDGHTSPVRARIFRL